MLDYEVSWSIHGRSIRNCRTFTSIHNSGVMFSWTAAQPQRPISLVRDYVEEGCDPAALDYPLVIGMRKW